MKIKELIKDKSGDLGARPWFLSIVLVMLCSAALIFFVISFLYANNANAEVLDTKYGLNDSFNSLNSALSTVGTNATDVKDKLATSQPTPLEFVFLIFENAFYIPKTFLILSVSGINTLVNVFYAMIFGTGMGAGLVLVMDILLAGIMITTVLLIIKSIRTGETER